MKKIDLGQAVQILANVGVLVGLVFLVLEIRQNTDAIRSGIVQSISDQTYESRRIYLENPDIRAALRAALAGDENEDQRDMVDVLYAAFLSLRQNRFLQTRLGAIDEETTEVLGTGGIYRQADFAAYWERNKGLYAPDFQAYVDRVLLGRDAD